MSVSVIEYIHVGQICSIARLVTSQLTKGEIMIAKGGGCGSSNNMIMGQYWSPMAENGLYYGPVQS